MLVPVARTLLWSFVLFLPRKGQHALACTRRGSAHKREASGCETIPPASQVYLVCFVFLFPKTTGCAQLHARLGSSAGRCVRLAGQGSRASFFMESAPSYDEQRHKRTGEGWVQIIQQVIRFQPPSPHGLLDAEAHAQQQQRIGFCLWLLRTGIRLSIVTSCSNDSVRLRRGQQPDLDPVLVKAG
jgi:hypothetical protein